MRRLTATLVSTAFLLILGVALLSAPATAVGHPGNTCNPSAGHGNTGCHRVTAPSGASTAKAAARRRATQHATALRTATAKRKAAARPAAAALTAPAPSAAAPIRPPAAPEPWWLAFWHYLFG